MLTSTNLGVEPRAAQPAGFDARIFLLRKQDVGAKAYQDSLSRRCAQAFCFGAALTLRNARPVVWRRHPDPHP